VLTAISMMADEETPQHLEDVPTAEIEGGGGGGEGSTEVDVAGYKISMADKQMPLVGIFFAAIILVIAMTTGLGKEHTFYGYGISVGAVSMFFSAVGIVFTLGGLKDSPAVSVMAKFNNYFLALWTFLGGLILTFWGPFQVTGNGYFAGK